MTRSATLESETAGGGGDVELLYSTTEMLRRLPPETVLYPGHDYRRRNLEFAVTIEPENGRISDRLRELRGLRPEDQAPTTLGDELQVNPFLRLNSLELRKNLLLEEEDLSEADQLERELFKRLRNLRDNW